MISPAIARRMSPAALLNAVMIWSALSLDRTVRVTLSLELVGSAEIWTQGMHKPTLHRSTCSRPEHWVCACPLHRSSPSTLNTAEPNSRAVLKP